MLKHCLMTLLFSAACTTSSGLECEDGALPPTEVVSMDEERHGWTGAELIDGRDELQVTANWDSGATGTREGDDTFSLVLNGEPVATVFETDCWSGDAEMRVDVPFEFFNTAGNITGTGTLTVRPAESPWYTWTSNTIELSADRLAELPAGLGIDTLELVARDWPWDERQDIAIQELHWGSTEDIYPVYWYDPEAAFTLVTTAD